MNRACYYYMYIHSLANQKSKIFGIAFAAECHSFSIHLYPFILKDVLALVLTFKLTKENGAEAKFFHVLFALLVMYAHQ